MNTIYLFLAEGFEEVEALTVVDVLRRAELDIVTVSITDNKLVKGAHGVSVEADQCLAAIKIEKPEMLILPGGMPGTLNLDQCEPLRQLLVEQNKRNGRIAAICAAPSVLGHLGILAQHQAVCYPGFEDELQRAFVRREQVCVSEHIITSRAPGTAMAFALTIVEQLLGKEKRDTIAAGLLYQ